jgi:hypothetical protein
MILKVDIYEPGNKKPKKLLAKIGEPVTLIARHDNIVIVECNGHRFSVKRDEVEYTTIDVSQS